MRSFILSAIAGTALLGAASIPSAQAAVSADINIHIGRRAPDVYFARAPRVVLIPDTEVYYVDDYDGYDDYDMYRCDGWWYINDGGYWYRSQNYRGPWIGISISTLPRRVLNVPIAYRHQPYRSPTWNRGYDDRYQQSRGTWSGRRRRQVTTTAAGRAAGATTTVTCAGATAGTTMTATTVTGRTVVARATAWQGEGQGPWQEPGQGSRPRQSLAAVRRGIPGRRRRRLLLFFRRRSPRAGPRTRNRVLAGRESSPVAWPAGTRARARTTTSRIGTFALRSGRTWAG